MTKIVRILFVVSALLILAEDSFQYVLLKDNAIFCQWEQDKDEVEKEDNKENEDNNETKDGKDEFKESNDKEKVRQKVYDILVLSKLSSSQFSSYTYKHSYVNCSRELESPPPEV